MRRILEIACVLGLSLFLRSSLGQERANLVSEKPGLPPPGLLKQYPAVLTHTHNWRFSGRERTANFEEAEQNLVTWCARLGIRAVGVGSAWDPENDAMFQRFEGPDRDLYYSGNFDQKSVMQEAHIPRVIADLNRLANGKTSFYLVRPLKPAWDMLGGSITTTTTRLARLFRIGRSSFIAMTLPLRSMQSVENRTRAETCLRSWLLSTALVLSVSSLTRRDGGSAMANS
jgi:hypothetical protein